MGAWTRGHEQGSGWEVILKKITWHGDASWITGSCATVPRIPVHPDLLRAHISSTYIRTQ
eukprot:158327-Chlamydomonas_euryale.AAC.1